MEATGSRRPPDPYAGAVGALARLSARHVLDAIGLARRGAIYDLGLELNERMPAWDRRALAPFTLVPYTASASPQDHRHDREYDFETEVVSTALHHGTHLDALNHVHDGDRPEGHGPLDGGVETVPPIVARCVLLDVAGHAGVDALADGHEIGIAELDALCRQRSIEIRPGDVVLVRTGKVRQFWSAPAEFVSGQPGVGEQAAVWLFEQGMSMLGTDTPGTEPSPSPGGPFATHRAMLARRGVHLVENLWLEALAADGVAEALFVCLPLKITGGTGSPVRPIAIV